MTAIELASVVLGACEVHDMSVTSWFRTQLHNDALPGSVKNSKHLKGMAFDLVPDRATNVQEIVDDFNDNFGLHAFWDKDHIHVEVKE